VNFNVKGKDILKDCWGHVPSGKVCAIMGPSGAGKSSILNVLAGRSASSSAGGITVTGNVSVGGTRINPVAFREHIAYVMQDDSLLATATPREALEFSAQLRLPSTTTKAEIDTIVNHLIVDLGLESCADVMIGGALIKVSPVVRGREPVLVLSLSLIPAWCSSMSLHPVSTPTQL
jgi:ABC-type multidrug transport system ATPase subunit